MVCALFFLRSRLFAPLELLFGWLMMCFRSLNFFWDIPILVLVAGMGPPTPPRSLTSLGGIANGRYDVAAKNALTGGASAPPPPPPPPPTTTSTSHSTSSPSSSKSSTTTSTSHSATPTAGSCAGVPAWSSAIAVSSYFLLPFCRSVCLVFLSPVSPSFHPFILSLFPCSFPPRRPNC